MSNLQEIPLFPLNSVLFPKGKLTLQIFERRYLDLVSRSLKSDTGFGITLLKEGGEVAAPGRKQTIHDMGTYARIVDWDQLPNGLLSIIVEGVSKFRIKEHWIADSDLLMARVCFSETEISGERSIPVQDECSDMTELLHVLEKHPAVQDMNLQIDYENLWELGWRLSELIPVSLEKKQELLELDDPWERIRNIEATVHFLEK
ncbi:MAG: LON peptidase substrate-binding domain-containing protein [Gammaproteobacteria bacterium]|nr:LON peptidase substrate-binding domain-containing protein [Gammaproteobacteria bacterium]